MIEEVATVEASHSLRRRTRRVLGIDLGGVRINLSGEPALRGAWGMVRGASISLSRESRALRSRDLLRLLGHELCHVAQQRVGAAAPAASLAALESQADRWGEALASGRPIREPALPASPSSELYAVWVGSRQIHAISDLDPSVEGVLTLIPGAGAWMRWAIKDAAVDLTFRDEPSLAMDVLRGLHNTDLISLRRSKLLVSPNRLLELGKHVIDVFVAYEGDEESNGTADRRATGLIEENHLLTMEQLAGALFKVESLGVGSDPMFGAPSLASLVALYEVFGDSSADDAESSKPAAKFAVDRAATPAEFADAYSFFETVASVGWDCEETKVAQATLLWELLAPDLQTRLLAPQLRFPLTAEEIESLPDRFQEIGLTVAFRTQASGARQIARFLAFKGKLGSPRFSTIDTFLEDAERFFEHAVYAGDRFSQDGRTQRLEFKNVKQGGSGMLVLDDTGCLTLHDYVPGSAQPALADRSSANEDAPHEA